MNRKIFLISFMCSLSLCYSTEIYRNGYIGDCDGWITEINQDELIVYTDFDKYDRDYNPKFLYSNGKFFYEGKLRFVDLRDKKKIDISGCKSERFLILKNSDIVIYYKNNKTAEFESFNPWLRGFNKGCYWLITETPSSSKVHTSSELNEKGNIYKGDNLLNQTSFDGINEKFFSLAEPWIEGKEDYGIGEYFELSGEGIWNDFIYISIGYVDMNKPYLYEQNSRPSVFDIYVDDKYWNTIYLEDSPDPQRFELPEKSLLKKDSKIRYVIKDIYKGDKYKDTCINFIFFAKESTTGYIE